VFIELDWPLPSPFIVLDWPLPSPLPLPAPPSAARTKQGCPSGAATAAVLLQRDFYSNRQWALDNATRRCKDCVEEARHYRHEEEEEELGGGIIATLEPAAMTRRIEPETKACTACGVLRQRSHFSNRQWVQQEGSRCTECIDRAGRTRPRTSAIPHPSETPHPSDVPNPLNQENMQRKRELEVALSQGCAKVAFEKKPEAENACPVCERAIWSNFDPTFVGKQKYEIINAVPAHGDVSTLVCKHWVHSLCMDEHKKDPKNWRPATNPMVPHNAACPHTDIAAPCGPAPLVQRRPVLNCVRCCAREICRWCIQHIIHESRTALSRRGGQ